MQRQPKPLFSTRTLLILTIAAVVGVLAALGAGIAAWRGTDDVGGDPSALLSALIAGGATLPVVFLGVVGALHPLVH